MVSVDLGTYPSVWAPLDGPQDLNPAILHETSSCRSRRSQTNDDSSYYDDEDSELAAIAIQSGWRMYKAKQQYQRRILSFTIYAMRYYSAKTIQRAWRGYHTRKVLLEEATSFVTKYPVCHCETSKPRRQFEKASFLGEGIFSTDPEPRKDVFHRVLPLEVLTFENWLRDNTNPKRGDKSSKDHHDEFSESPRKTQGGSAGAKRRIKAHPRSIISTLRTKSPFQFFDGIIHSTSDQNPWSQTYVRPNIPEECTFIENNVKTQLGTDRDADAPAFLGYCMRRPLCFDCGRRLKELSYDTDRSMNRALRGGNESETNQLASSQSNQTLAPVWTNGELQVAGSFDALPWINVHQMAYCSLRRSLKYSIPKASIVTAHSVSRHLVAKASNSTRSSGNNYMLGVIYTCAIQELLDLMLQKMQRMQKDAKSLEKRSPIAEHPQLMDCECIQALGPGELKHTLEVYINHRFGSKSLIAIDFKYVNTKPSGGPGDPPQVEWLINDDLYSTISDAHNNLNNHAKLVV